MKHENHHTMGSQRRSNMDRSRRDNRERHVVTFQYKSRQEVLFGDELTEHKLTQLLAFIDQLKRTPEGTADIRRRVKLFGKCKRDEGETSVVFYRRLRHWLDRDIPETKTPLHPPRQTRTGPTT
jgi:hypothetical protein